MTVRIGINGFGRIGRNYLRAARSMGADVDVVAINDLTSAETLAHLLRYDSTHGRFGGEVQVEGSQLILDTGPITVLAEREPKALPWNELGVDVVVESTGLFTSRESAAAHLDAGATRVIISAPATDVDATFVIGVNDSEFDPAKDFVVSNASCTTNCFVPMVKVLDDAPTTRTCSICPTRISDGHGQLRSTSFPPRPGRPGPPAWSSRR
jgi:glyceraldehyde 3-phosphate dehydrogenase